MVQENFRLVWQNTLDCEAKKAKNPLSFPSINTIKKIIKHTNEIKDQTIVVKLPTYIIQNNALLENFIENIHIISSCGAKIIIIHDYAGLVENTLKSLGINTSQISDYQNPQLVEMVLSGHINKYIVTKLNEFGCYSVGISGKDGNLIQAKKSKQHNKRLNDHDVIDIGFISEPIVVNPEILLNFEDIDIIPVIAPIAADDKGNTHLLDVNLTAAAIASFLDADHLILPIIMEEETINEENFKTNDFKTLKNIVMGIKTANQQSIIEAALNIIEHSSNNSLHIVNAKLIDCLILSLFTVIKP